MNTFVIRRDRGRKIVKHATHFDVAFELIQRDLFRRATRHTMRATWREVTAGRQISRPRHHPFDRFQPFLLNHRVARQFWH